MSADAHATLDVRDRRLLPVTEVGLTSMILVIVGVILMASYLPKPAPLTVPVILLVAAAVLFAVNLALLSRLRDYAWWRFSQVARWSLLAYCVIAGMLEFTFVYDDVRGSHLVVLTLLLALFTANVPILLAFTVARYERRARRD